VYLRAEIPRAHASAAILGEERMGAGVAVSRDHVLTAHYLVLGASRVELTGLDGRTRDVRHMALDHETGLALLTVGRADLEPARLAPGAHELPARRSRLPAHLHRREGEARRERPRPFVGPFEAFWEYTLDRAIMTTMLNPGLAGGPLFDARARVAGIVSLGLAAVARFSLAIPIALFEGRRARLERGEDPPPGERRAWLGFYPQASDDGIAVTGVVPGGPAESAGLKRGDLLVSVDGQAVLGLRQLYEAIWTSGPGQLIGMQVLRDEAIQVVQVLAGDRYEFFK
jgi:S1-C subfamily serine protease